MNNESTYKFTKKFLEIFEQILSVFLQQFIGTYSGKVFLKWLTDYLIKNFFDTIVTPLARVWAIKAGYKVHIQENKIKIEKLTQAEEADEQTYYDTLNDVLR